MRLHSFGQRFPNSGALRRLIGEFHTNISKRTEAPDDIDVQVAILTDIAFVSPSTFPVVAGILSHFISLAVSEDKIRLWEKVYAKMKRVPYNGYLEIWLQRVTQPKAVGIKFESNESICKIVNRENINLWESGWISSKELKSALDVKKILISDPSEAMEVIDPKEIQLFKENAWMY